MQTTILLSPVFNSNSQREVKLNTKVQDFHEKRTAVLWILLYTLFILEITALLRSSYDVEKIPIQSTSENYRLLFILL